MPHAAIINRNTLIDHIREQLPAQLKGMLITVQSDPFLLAPVVCAMPREGARFSTTVDPPEYKLPDEFLSRVCLEA